MPPDAVLPWRDGPDGVTFLHADGSAVCALNRAGVTIGDKQWPWPEVLDLTVTLPTSSRRGHRANAILSGVGPRFYDHSPPEETVSLDAARWPAEVTLGRHRQYSWREAFVLAEFTSFLPTRKALHALATPGLLTQVMRTVPNTVPARARPLVRVDLLGLDRRLGGHRAYDSEFMRLLDDRG